MLDNLEEMQKAAKLQLEPVTKSTMVLMKGAVRITSEAAMQVSKSGERFLNYYERLASAKGIDETLRTNAEFAATNAEHFFSDVAKMAECCASIAKDASTPVGEAVKTASNSVIDIASRSAAETRARVAG